MKLRNKKTGEIKEYGSVGATTFGEGGVLKGFAVYNSLAELNEEWEDYEEPKGYCYIDDAGVIQIDQVLSPEINMRKSIGNYFETKEEAERAVEKLKAWKRLKDSGFMAVEKKLHGDYVDISFIFNYTMSRDDKKDLDLLFGGEE